MFFTLDGWSEELVWRLEFEEGAQCSVVEKELSSVPKADKFDEFRQSSRILFLSLLSISTIVLFVRMYLFFRNELYDQRNSVPNEEAPKKEEYVLAALRKISHVSKIDHTDRVKGGESV